MAYAQESVKTGCISAVFCIDVASYARNPHGFQCRDRHEVERQGMVMTTTPHGPAPYKYLRHGRGVLPSWQHRQGMCVMHMPSESKVMFVKIHEAGQFNLQVAITAAVEVDVHHGVVVSLAGIVIFNDLDFASVMPELAVAD